ncbi:MAG: hypothetical protein ACR2PF_14025 [Rhizobiaceae bacterium]
MAISAFVKPLLLYFIVMDAAHCVESERGRNAAGLLHLSMRRRSGSVIFPSDGLPGKRARSEG